MIKHPNTPWTLRFTLAANALAHPGQDFVSFGAAKTQPLSFSYVDQTPIPILRVQITTTSHEQPLSLGVPLGILKTDQKHDFLLRYLGYRVDLFCDGVLLDQEWPMGNLQFASDSYTATFHEPFERPELRMGLLSDDGVDALYGGKAAVGERANRMLGPEPTEAQYMKPRGWDTNAGDAMPFYHDGTFHLFYLIDRRHHHSKWGLGAHQWAHISSTDLIHWTSYPIALPITEQWEGSICTGSVFYDKGTYYAFYATRMPDRKERLAMALSKDGVHYEKVLPTPFMVPKAPFRQGPNRDPHVNRDGNGFLMLVTAALEARKKGQDQGALEQLKSEDLQHWSALETPFLLPGYSPQPECSDLFEWRGRFYLLFGVAGITHYRIGSSLHGPWSKPDIDTLDAEEARVMKTAAFHNDRRILVGWVGYDNFGGNLIFRELVQNPDSTLGTKLVKEMLPHNEQQKTMIHVGKDHSSVPLKDYSTAEFHLILKAHGSSSGQPYGLTFERNGRTETLLIIPAEETVEWLDTAGRQADRLADMPQLQQQANIEIVRKGDLVDLCVNGHRTMIHRLQSSTSSISIFTRGSDVEGLTRMSIMSVKRGEDSVEPPHLKTRLFEMGEASHD